MDFLALAARAEAGLPSVRPPPDSQRVFLYTVPDPEGGPYTISRLREAASSAGVTLFREGRAPKGEARRFYVTEPVPQALRPWTSLKARLMENAWLRRKRLSDILIAAAAGAEARGRARAVALPDPAKDREAYTAACARLRAMPPARRADVALETRRVASLMPDGRVDGLRRALDVLGSVPTRVGHPSERQEGR